MFTEVSKCLKSYNLEEMYGDNYGYRSGLNGSTVRHLQQKNSTLEQMVKLTDADLVIDIGGNDSTSLQAYPAGECANKLRGQWR